MLFSPKYSILYWFKPSDVSWYIINFCQEWTCGSWTMDTSHRPTLHFITLYSIHLNSHIIGNGNCCYVTSLRSAFNAYTILYLQMIRFLMCFQQNVLHREFMNWQIVLSWISNSGLWHLTVCCSKWLYRCM